jgi:inorganic pyrophosphatase
MSATSAIQTGAEDERRNLAKSKNGIADPTRLNALTKEEDVQVIIETPKGSRNKYAWDPDQQVFVLKKVLPEGMAFPHDFGFIPSTQAEDGDPVDVLVLMDQSAFTGCLLKCRLVGIIEGEQTEDGKTERNDRLLAVSNTSHTHSQIKSIKDINKTLLEEVQKFLMNYHASDSVTFKVIACKGPAAAQKCLKKAMK